MAHVSRSKQAAVTRARTLPNCHVPAPTAETRVAPMVVVVERRRAGSPAAGEAATTGLATASDAAREAAPSSAPRRVGGGDFSAAGSSQRVTRVARRVPRRVGLLATPCSASMAPASHEAASSQLLASAAREWSGGVVTLRSAARSPSIGPGIWQPLTRLNLAPPPPSVVVASAAAPRAAVVE